MGELNNFLQIYTPYIVVPISLLGWLLCLVGVIYNQKLFSYLKANKPERLKEWSPKDILFSKFPGKPIRYIFDNQDDEVEEILRLKKKIRKFLKFGISLFVGPPIVFVFLFIICAFFIKH